LKAEIFERYVFWEKNFWKNIMRRSVHIDELREHLIDVQAALLRERDAILALLPPQRVAHREEYAFMYVRAEHFGQKAIELRLAGLAWLPLGVDISPEMMGKNRSPLNRWILSYATQEPTSADFGNELMHVLTRCALHKGWGSPVFLRLAARVASLFHDLACVLNAAYFLTWFSSNNVARVALDLSGDVLHTATEMSHAIQSPETFVLARGESRRRRRPHLHVVRAEGDSDSMRT
jgi:hypothetical protein